MRARIALGRKLFYDRRLSANGTKSCASCHNPAFAFSDGYRRSVTAFGENVRRNAPSLINAAYRQVYDWADPSVTDLARQSSRPLFGNHPRELGWASAANNLLQIMEADSGYRRAFRVAFDTSAASVPHLQDALAAFVQSLRSFQSPYDAWVRGDAAAITPSARQGAQLFFSERLQCSSCHQYPLFTVNARGVRLSTGGLYFNTGLYECYPATDEGLCEATHSAADKGKFAVPSLRNVALTGPYYHDGSANTLGEIIDNYAAGGRRILQGPDAGYGRNHPQKDARIRGFRLTPVEKQALIDFLCALTDTTVLHHPEWGPPPQP